MGSSLRRFEYGGARISPAGGRLDARAATPVTRAHGDGGALCTHDAGRPRAKRKQPITFRYRQFTPYPSRPIRVVQFGLVEDRPSVPTSFVPLYVQTRQIRQRIIYWLRTICSNL